jgi:hypothetical protein
MNLERELKEKIDAIKDEDWEVAHLRLSTGESAVLAEAEIILIIDGQTALSMMPFCGAVNAAEFAGMSPEKILVASCGTGSDGPYFVFRIRKTQPWTHFAHIDGKYRRIVDAKGEPAFKPVDFKKITNAADNGVESALCRKPQRPEIET